MRNIILILLILNAFACKSSSQDAPEEFIKGVYGNPETLLKAGYSFDSLGMNAVFVRSGSLNQEFYNNSKNQGVQVFVEFAMLNGKEYLTENPDAWPTDEKGQKSPPADWFMGICPTHPGFKAFRSEQLKNILRDYEVDGVFLDYVHWHAQFETPEPILPETCFCDRCTGAFEKARSIQIPFETVSERAAWILKNVDPEWRKWRVGVLNGWVEDMGEILKSQQPAAKLGVFHCAWYPTDYDSALYKTMGLDLIALAERVDVLSPMLFHHMKGRPTSWVGEYVSWLGQTLGVGESGKLKIWPIVQSHNNPGSVSAEEFRKVMIEGSKFPSSGIMMFSDQSLLEDPDKILVMKDLYTGELP
ncbi:hypothetical protein LV84_00629 [Algoriphagus ratkowskyi]|uniref:Glycosyl hydrolase-like 10 domain-containing protein n=1 Tax=Algoriphagus ratkowskyi TaxID=57028 RepID=A0A2W7RHI4_9BACT|nr:hypothetical protein [Algoriphagus ratkowskyi]PZX60353.1 hypothetical protein LV84_00629 [Algoriphagus ratkowskyi]TXD78170.1 hypothetical protein ESW18_09000 [Algoriphagus ratkowskyi]